MNRWERFESIATAIAVVAGMVAIAICIYFEITIGL